MSRTRLIAISEKRKPQLGTKARRLRPRIDQSLVQGCRFRKSSLLIQRFGVERPGERRFFSFRRHASRIIFHLVKQGNA